jgi:hypothetical protein
MAQGAATRGLEQADAADGAAHGALQGALDGVVPPDDAGPGVGRPSSGGEEVLPGFAHKVFCGQDFMGKLRRLWAGV